MLPAMFKQARKRGAGGKPSEPNKRIAAGAGRRVAGVGVASTLASTAVPSPSPPPPPPPPPPAAPPRPIPSVLQAAVPRVPSRLQRGERRGELMSLRQTPAAAPRLAAVPRAGGKAPRAARPRPVAEIYPPATARAVAPSMKEAERNMKWRSIVDDLKVHEAISGTDFQSMQYKPLPMFLLVLAEQFYQLHVVTRRQQTLAELKGSVQRQSGHTLSEADLGRMLTLYPGAFNIVDGKLENPAPPRDFPGRKRRFYIMAWNFVDRQHQDFLASLEPDQVKPAGHWHPRFKLEELDVPVAPTGGAGAGAAVSARRPSALAAALSKSRKVVLGQREGRRKAALSVEKSKARTPAASFLARFSQKKAVATAVEEGDPVAAEKLRLIGELRGLAVSRTKPMDVETMRKKLKNTYGNLSALLEDLAARGPWLTKERLLTHKKVVWKVSGNEESYRGLQAQLQPK